MKRLPKLLVPWFAPALLLAPPAFGQAVPPDLLVSSRFGDEILRYDGATGDLVGVFASGGGLDNPVGITFGPDGHLYVASADTHEVLRYDGTNGTFLDVFATGDGLRSPRQLNFGPDGRLYVASGTKDEVRRHDGSDGTFLGLAASGGGLDGPTSFTFGRDGLLYVVSVNTDTVKRYDPATGTYLGDFVTRRLDAPHDVAFGPDGLLYVTNALKTKIQAYDPATGLFVRTFVDDLTLLNPLGMTWDGAGRYYVVNQGRNQVRRYDARTGVLVDVFVKKTTGGLDAPLFLTFMPRAAGPAVEAVVPGVAGVSNHVRAAGFRPGRKVFLLCGSPSAGLPMPRCGGPALLLMPVHVLIAAMADESGAVSLIGDVPLALAGRTVHLQALAPRSCEASPLTSVTF